MSAFYAATNPTTEEESIAVIHAAIDAGCTFLDTAAVYGPHTNEVLVGKALKKYPRAAVTVATKCGIEWSPEKGMFLDGSRASVRASCEASLARLDTPFIDLFYLHRRDPATPITETAAEMKALVEEGKIRHYGLSECSAADIRAAHAVHPVTAVQLEWSLWTRDVEEEIVPTCRELGIGIVAYSPLGRGFLTGTLSKPADLDAEDWRLSTPRFQDDAFKKNMAIVEAVRAAAAQKGCTPAQMALAWVLAQGPDVVPIPGTRRLKYLEENLGAAGVSLTAEEVADLGDAVAAHGVEGERYPEDHMPITFIYDKL